MIHKIMKRSLIFGFLFASLFGSFLSAQDSRFRGVVTDEDGNPIPKAKITLTLIARNYTFDFETDKKGKFYRRGIEPGEYMLKVDVENYQPFQQQIYIQVGQEYKMDIIIAKSASEQQVKNLEAKGKFEEGVRFYQQGKLEDAIKAFEQVIALVPDFAEGYYNLGMAHLRKGDIDSAISIMQKAIDLKPDFIEAYFGLGQAYVEKGEEEKATEVFQKAVSSTPDDPKAYFSLGVLYFSNNKDDLALDVLLKAKDLDPTMPQIYYQLGLVYTRKGEMDSSIKSFEKFLELAPDSAEAATVRTLLEEIRKKQN
ncbi:MAG: tetratricopeptide repeat protein [Candidatus Aminicenantes bacterium]|nr:tetratricopeptide repeat protein [Candidatus Aminicenantes bacterium]